MNYHQFERELKPKTIDNLLDVLYEIYIDRKDLNMNDYETSIQSKDDFKRFMLDPNGHDLFTHLWDLMSCWFDRKSIYQSNLTNEGYLEETLGVKNNNQIKMENE